MQGCNQCLFKTDTAYSVKRRNHSIVTKPGTRLALT